MISLVMGAFMLADGNAYAADDTPGLENARRTLWCPREERIES